MLLATLLLSFSTSEAASSWEGGSCQPGFVHDPTKVRTCEPCEEAGVAYPGNNIHLTPHYGVDTVLRCRDLCQAESRCHYWTWDKTNNWCYLKHAKSTANTIMDTRYTSGINNPLCQAEEENEVKQDDEDDDVRQPRKVLDVGQYQGPLLVIHDSDGNRTILPAIPATFGLAIQKSSEVRGTLEDMKSLLCSPVIEKPDNANSGLFAVVTRGDCKFSVKAEFAARAGYRALIILDNKNNTNVEKISGVRSLYTDNLPVIFLLQDQAAILESILSKESVVRASIAGSIESTSSETATTKKLTTPTSTTTTVATTVTRTTTRKPYQTSLDASRDFFAQFARKNIFKKQPPFVRYHQTNAPFLPVTEETAEVLIIPDSKANKTFIDFTPLTIGSISVGVVVSILLIISIVTLIVSRVRRSSRRRTQHTRCQQAIREFESMNRNLAKDNSGFSGDGDGSGQSANPTLPPSTYSLLECPVCLEIAWPPKKIFQCREGHIVCDTCKSNPNLKNCPMCRIPLSSHLTSRNRSLEEVARTLLEENGRRDLVNDNDHAVILSIPTAPVLESITEHDDNEESEDNHRVIFHIHNSTDTDTNQLIEDSNRNPEASTPTEIIVATPLVVNLPPDSD